MARRSIATALLLGSALALPLPAHALEAEPFAEALKALLEAQQFNLGYEGAILDGDTVTMTGVTIAPVLPEGATGGASDAGSMTLPLGELVFEGVAETEIGYEAASMIREGVTGSVDDIGEEGDDVAWSIGRIGMEGITVPNEDADGPVATMIRFGGFFYDRGFVEDMTLSLNGRDYVTLASADIRTDVDATPATFAYEVDDLTTDLTVVADEAPELRAWIEGTGYDTIVADAASEGTWNLEDGSLDVPTSRLTFEGMGELDMAIAMGGLTPAFVEAMGKASDQMQSGDAQAQQAAGMQLLGLMSQLSFGELTFVYRDGGMADTLLEYYASENGQTKDELVQQTVGVLPLVLGQIGVPEFQAQVQEALTGFLNDPKSITVSLKPDAPVPAPVLMGAAASSPAQLIDALNASVTSGQAGMME